MSGRGRVASRDLQLLNLPDSGNLLGTKRVEQISQMLFQVIKGLTLGPVVRVVIQVPEESAVTLLPIREPSFHGCKIPELRLQCERVLFGERSGSGTPGQWCPIAN